MLDRLGPTDCALLSRVGKPWPAAVVSRGLPRAGRGGAVPLKLISFGSVEVLAWVRRMLAQANGCPWEEGTCNHIAAGRHLAVLQWAREHHCPWDRWSCHQRR